MLMVSDLRPDIYAAGHARAVEIDIAWLRDRSGSFVAVACPVCGKGEQNVLYKKAGFDHRSCSDCGTLYISPRPDAETVLEFYKRSENYRYWATQWLPATSETRRKYIFAPRAARAVRWAEQLGVAEGCLIEVGAGSGLFCDECRRQGRFCRIVAIEPRDDLAQACLNRQIETIPNAWEDSGSEAKADMIAGFELIEHLFDPAAFLHWCASTLPQAGVLMLSSPNVAGFEIRTLGDASNTVCHEHLNLFNLNSLCRLLDVVGFDIVDTSTPGELDVEIVRRAADDGSFDIGVLDPETAAQVFHDDPAVRSALQESIKESRASSHMVVVATKR